MPGKIRVGGRADAGYRIGDCVHEVSMETRLRCERCWKRLPVTARFCPRCGNTLRQVPVLPPTSRRRSGPPFFLLILTGGWLACTLLRLTVHETSCFPPSAVNPPAEVYEPQRFAPAVPAPRAPWIDPPASPAPPTELSPQRPHARRHSRPWPNTWYRPTDPPPAAPLPEPSDR